jgi:hypothetical protein
VPALVSLQLSLHPWAPSSPQHTLWRLAHDTPVTPVGLIRPAQYGLHCVLRRGSSLTGCVVRRSRLTPVHTWNCDLAAMITRCLSRRSGDNIAAQDLQASSSYSPRLFLMLGHHADVKGASVLAPNSCSCHPFSHAANAWLHELWPLGHSSALRFNLAALDSR